MGDGEEESLKHALFESAIMTFFFFKKENICLRSLIATQLPGKVKSQFLATITRLPSGGKNP